jgi:hypothetical protein
LSQEFYDTRLKPGEKLSLISEFPLPVAGELTVGFRIDVNPDELYIRTFEERMNDEQIHLSESAKKSLISAIQEKRSSQYNLFTLLKPVPLL